MASKLGLPAGLWNVNPRPYFQQGLQGLTRNLPWGHQNVISDTDRNHQLFEESGFEIIGNLGHGSFSKVVVSSLSNSSINFRNYAKM